jgi:hypothetical protein
MTESGTNEYVEVNGLEMEVLYKNTRDLLFKIRVILCSARQLPIKGII